MDCPPGQKEVAVVKRWPLVEVRLYVNKVKVIIGKCIKISLRSFCTLKKIMDFIKRIKRNQSSCTSPETKLFLFQAYIMDLTDLTEKT